MATKDILMDGDKVCIAWFKKKIKKYILTTKAEPPEGGTVTGAGTYNEGTTVTVEAIPAVDYEFDHWGGIDKIVKGFVTSYDTVEEFADTWLANGFTEIRFCTDYTDTTKLNASKAAIIAGNAKGLKLIWGVTSNNITSSNWLIFRQAILDAAQWAQDNGVYEFQIGNEEENHIDGTIAMAQLVANLKAVATEVQAIFTNGKVSYSCYTSLSIIDYWVSVGKGDIDIIACNSYMGGTTFNDEWKTEISNLINAFGVDHVYVSEFAPSYISLDSYSTDEVVQAMGVTEMINYFKASGIKKVLFFEWIGEEYGVVKFVGEDKVYRLLWDSLLNSN